MIKHPQCRPDLTTTYVPIYYMPSHTVALDCAACSIDKLENDSPKIWRMAHEDNFYKTLEVNWDLIVLRTFLHWLFLQNLRDSLNWVHIKMGLMEINSNEVAGTFMNERQTTARQSGTRLYLIGATPFAGGLYTCDLAYLPLGNVPEVVYVVMPMVIPTRLQPLLGWRSTEFYFPYLPIYGRFHDNVLWGWNWMWTAILHPVTQVRNVSAVPMWNGESYTIRAMLLTF